jgi:DNA polymerase-3 subunit alpha (Gram-positive type)
MAYTANQDRNLLFLDSETTGLSADFNEAIEWACVLTKPDGITVIETYEAKVKPLHMDRFDAKAKEVNGYNEAEWADAPPAALTAAGLHSIAKDAILVGQNVSFDEGFLTAFLKQRDLKPSWHYHKVDTMGLAWPLIKSGAIDGLSLANLAKWAGVEQTKPHRAMSDVLCVQKVYLALMAKYATL